MNCRRTQMLLSRARDSGVSDFAEAIGKHRSTCEACRMFEASLGDIARAFALVAEAPVPEGLAERLATTSLTRPPEPTTWVGDFVHFALPTAALGLVAAILLFAFGATKNEAPRRETAQREAVERETELDIVHASAEYGEVLSTTIEWTGTAP